MKTNLVVNRKRICDESVQSVTYVLQDRGKQECTCFTTQTEVQITGGKGTREGLAEKGLTEEQRATAQIINSFVINAARG